MAQRLLFLVGFPYNRERVRNHIEQGWDNSSHIYRGRSFQEIELGWQEGPDTFGYLLCPSPILGHPPILGSVLYAVEKNEATLVTGNFQEKWKSSWGSLVDRWGETVTGTVPHTMLINQEILKISPSHGLRDPSLPLEDPSSPPGLLDLLLHLQGVPHRHPCPRLELLLIFSLS